MQLFGFELKKAGNDKIFPNEVVVQRTEDAPNEIYGAVGASLVQYYDQYLTIPQDEIQLIMKYREISMHPEIDKAVEEVVNDAITEERGNPFYVKLDLEDTELSSSIKKMINEEFDIILRLLKFNRKAYQLFRNWYIDGRMYHHIVIDGKNMKKGIQKLSFIDPIHIKKYRNIQKNPDTTINNIEEFYVYAPTLTNINAWDGKRQDQIVKFPPDSINYVPSGLVNGSRDRVLSFLHKAIKAANNLSMLEDAVVIYRIVRAPERRVFYIDVGNLPKTKAEAYLNTIMNRYRNKISYDSNDGQLSDGRRQLSMLEDFWLPRRDGGRGTEIDTLQGGQGLGEMDDVTYFRKKLYDSLNVPQGRMESEGMFNVGRSSEITREELKFAKFIEKLRKTFAHGLFDDLLQKQLILKGIIKADEWAQIETGIHYIFSEDSYYSELKSLEILKDRLEVLQGITEHVDTYFSPQWVRENILFQTEEEQEELKKQREEATKDGDPAMEPEEADGGEGGFGGGGFGGQPAEPKPMPVVVKKEEPGKEAPEKETQSKPAKPGTTK